MSELTILNVVGCRPNFVKIAPLMAEMSRHPEIRPVLIHTGQHSETAMSDVFFQDLDIPRPDVLLGIANAQGASGFAQITVRLEQALMDLRPDLVLVVGDVTSTAAAAWTSVNLGIPVAHVEAGLRSFDREMPEEINRVLTDALSDFLFVTEPSAITNLLREGKRKEQIFFAGNVMIDSLMSSLPRAEESGALGRLALEPKSYALLTLHRPANVDTADSLRNIACALECLQENVRIIFPVHPRTADRLGQFEKWDELFRLPNIQLIDPLRYLDFIKVMKESLFVLTDSGGVQEESTALGIPCLTLRENTERPITLLEGTNRLVGASADAILSGAIDILRNPVRKVCRLEGWDGHAAKRIVSELLKQQEQIRALYRSVRERKLWSSNPTLTLQCQA